MGTELLRWVYVMTVHPAAIVLFLVVCFAVAMGAYEIWRG